MSENYSDDMRKILDMLDDITEDEAGGKSLLTESEQLDELNIPSLNDAAGWAKDKLKKNFTRAGQNQAQGEKQTKALAQRWEDEWHKHVGSTGTEQNIDELASFLQHQVRFVPHAIQQIISTATGNDISLNGNTDNTQTNTKGPEQQPAGAGQSNQTTTGPENQQAQQGSSSPTLSTSTSFTHNSDASASWGQNHTVTHNPANTTNTPAAGNGNTEPAVDPEVNSKNATSGESDGMDDKQVKTALSYLRSSLKQQNNADAQKTIINLHRNFGKISDDMKSQVAPALIKAGEELVNSKTVSPDDLNQLKKDLGKYLSQPSTPAPKIKPRTTSAPVQNQKQKIAASYLNLGNLLKECGDDILEETSEYKSYMFEADPPQPEEGQVNGSMPLDNTEVKKIFIAAAQYAVKKGLVGSRNNNGAVNNVGNNTGNNNVPNSGNNSGNSGTTGPANVSGSSQSSQSQQSQPQNTTSNLNQASHIIGQFTDLNKRTIDYVHDEVYHARNFKDVDTKHKDSLAKIGFAYLKSLR